MGTGRAKELEEGSLGVEVGRPIPIDRHGTMKPLEHRVLRCRRQGGNRRDLHEARLDGVRSHGVEHSRGVTYTKLMCAPALNSLDDISRQRELINVRGDRHLWQRE